MACYAQGILKMKKAKMDRRNVRVIEAPEPRGCSPTLNRPGLTQCAKWFHVGDREARGDASTGSLSESGVRHFLRESIQSSYPAKKKLFLVNSSSLQGPSLRIQK